MKAMRLPGIIALCLVVGASFATADSLQLRNGGHLQGKYVGGTTTMVGFMTAGTIQYFPTSDVLALIFEANSDAPLSGLQPNPMNGHSSLGAQKRVAVRKVQVAQEKPAKPRLRVTVNTTLPAHPLVTVETKCEPVPSAVQAFSAE